MNVLRKCLGHLLALVLASATVGAFAQLGEPSTPKPTQERIIFASGEHVKLAARYYDQALRTPEPESRQYMSTALEEAQLALRIYPDNARAHGLLGLIYMVLKDNQKAGDAFSWALRLTPDDADLNNNYGLFLCESGKPKQSLEYFLKAVRNPLYETPDIAYTNVGRCAARAGDDAAAETYLNRALERVLDGGPLAKIELAKLYFRRGQYEKARVYLGDVVGRLNVVTPDALLLGVRIERKLGNQIEEKSYEQRLRNRFPNSQEYQDLSNGTIDN
jgi:type IV pilus assembly protein PilF